eukprot:Skav204568  [mRNA]  locus=scaffold2218:98490:99903:- [translate_table: standard]
MSGQETLRQEAVKREQHLADLQDRWVTGAESCVFSASSSLGQRLQLVEKELQRLQRHEKERQKRRRGDGEAPRKMVMVRWSSQSEI